MKINSENWYLSTKSIQLKYIFLTLLYVAKELVAVTVIKHHNKGNLFKKELILTYGSRKIRIHYGGEAWKKTAGLH